MANGIIDTAYKIEYTGSKFLAISLLTFVFVFSIANITNKAPVIDI